MEHQTFLQRLNNWISEEREKGKTKRLQWLLEKRDEHLVYLWWCKNHEIEPLL